MQIVSHIILNNTSSIRADLYTAIKNALMSYSDICFDEDNLKINNIKEHHGRFLVRFTIEFEDNLSESNNSVVETIFNTISSLIPGESKEQGLLKFLDDNQLSINIDLYARIYKTEMKIREILFFILWIKYGEKDVYHFLSRFGSNFNANPSKDFKNTFDHQLFYIMFSKYKELTKYQNLNTFSITQNKTKDSKEIYLSKVIDKCKSIDELVVFLKSIWIEDSKHIGILNELETYLDSIEKLRNAIAHNRHIEQDVIDNAMPAIDAVNILIDDYWDKDIYEDMHLKDIILKWFFENYEDPANGVPFNSKEGGYQYMNGGPFYANELIEENFPEIDEGIISDAVMEIEYEGTEWVKIGDY